MNRTQSDNMIRQQQGMPPLGQMPLNTSHFLQNQQQPGQQQQPSARMNLVPNSNSNPAAMLGNPQPNSANTSQISAAQYQLSLQRRQQLYFQQSQNAQMNGSPNTSAAPHMGASPHNAMGFPGTMIQQGNGGQLRRVASHPQSLNQTAGHVGGMHPGQQGVATLSMGMNPQTSLPAHLRQAQQQQQQQHQQMGVRMPQMQGPISPDIPMAIGRQPNPGMPQNPTRASTSSAQLMASLAQPSSLVQAQSGGGQPPLSLPQSGFQHSIPHQTSSLSSSSPRPGNHPQNLNPAGMSMATSGSSQGSGPRAPPNSDNVMFMNFHNPPYSQTHGRMQQGGPQFAFNPSSGSPSQQIDISQSLNGAPLNSSNPPNRSNFQPTPAQQYEHMQQTENFNTHYNMPPPPPTNVPPRPPSHPNPNPHHGHPLPRQQQPHQHSPHQSDHMVNHIPQPPRPQSQPQVQPGRPSSQAGPSHTPRSTQAQLTPGSGHLSQARIPPAPQPHQSPHQPQHPAQQQPIAPRPAPLPVSAATPSSSAPPTMASSDGGPSNASRQQQQNLLTLPIGLGQGLIRLLQFSGVLSGENHSKLQLSYWENLVKEYFMPKAAMKLTLWKDNQKTEARPFDIGVPILPRFFLVTTQSGVKSMTLSLDGARERLVNHHHAVVECVTAVWTYRYINGYTVTLRGPLTAHVLLVPTTNLAAGAAQQSSQQLPYVLKFDNLEFHANLHDKYIALESLLGQRVIGSPKTPRTRNESTPILNGNATSEEDKKWEEPRVMIEHASIPGEPVNAFGIPQATMRCLELAESVGQMTDLIAFSNETKLGPMDALKKFAVGIKENQAQNLGPPGTLAMSNGAGPVNFQSFQGLNGVHSAPVTLYSGVPSVNPSSIPQPRPSTDSPQNNHLSIDTPQKNKGQPQSQGSGSAPLPLSSTSSAPTTSQTSANTTPSIGHATLKRKPNDTNSPTTSNAEQPPNKRVTRKRGRTAGG